MMDLFEVLERIVINIVRKGLVSSVPFGGEFDFGCLQLLKVSDVQKVN